MANLHKPFFYLSDNTSDNSLLNDKSRHYLKFLVYINYASVNSKRENPPSLGNPRGFAPIFIPGPGDFYHLNCPGVGPIIKVLSCQLMPHEGTFQLQTDLPSVAALWLQNLFQSWGKNFLSMMLKLKLEGMTKE